MYLLPGSATNRSYFQSTNYVFLFRGHVNPSHKLDVSTRYRTYKVHTDDIPHSLEAYLVLLAASIPTLRPLLGSKTKSSIKSTTIKPTCAANSWHSDNFSNGHHPPCRTEEEDIFFSLKDPCTSYSQCDGSSNSNTSSIACLPKVGGGGRGGGTGGVNFSRVLERSRRGGGGEGETEEVSEEDRKVIKMETKMSVVYHDVNV